MTFSVFSMRELAIWLSILIVATPALSQTADRQATSTRTNESASLSGVCQYEKTELDQKKRMEAITLATNDLGRLMRGRARQAMSNSTLPTRKLNLIDGGDKFSLEMNGRQVTLNLDNKAVELKGEKGPATVSASRTQGKIKVVAKNKSGTRTTEYQLSDDGSQLVLNIEMVINKLNKTVKYQATYTRK